MDLFRYIHRYRHKTDGKHTAGKIHGLEEELPLLYTQLQTSSLLWPSLSLDWLPDTTTPQIQSENNFEYDYNHHRLLLSTFSDGINPLESILLTRLNLFDLRSKNFKNLENFDYIPSSNEFTYSLPLPHLKTLKNLQKLIQVMK